MTVYENVSPLPRVPSADDVTLTTMLERRVVAPWGFAGGADGGSFRIVLNPGPGARLIPGKATLTLARGDRVVIETSGGGGYGPPAQRDPEARTRDREEGYV